MTLYHWDLPQALEDEGGWRIARHGRALRRVRATCFDAYGDRVGWWLTINEPWIVGLLGYLHGLHAPGYQGRRARRGRPSFHHLLLAHGRAVAGVPGRRAATAASGSRSPLRRTTPRATTRPTSRRRAPPTATSTAGSSTRCSRGSYPDDMRARYEQLIGPLDFVRDGDLDTIAAPGDFLGVNYYARRVMQAAPGVTPLPWRVSCRRCARRRLHRRRHRDGGRHEIARRRSRDLLVRLRDDYGDVPILITENGAVFPEPGARRAPGALHPRPPRRAARRDRAGRAGASATATGRCWTTSSGRSATRSASGSCTSTTRRRRGRSRTAAATTRASPRANALGERA